MKLILFLSTLIISFPLFAQEDIADKNIQEIISISQKKTLTPKDYSRVKELMDECPDEIYNNLDEKGILYEFKAELLDAIYRDAFVEFKDTSAIKRRIDICLWSKGNYPKDERIIKIADSRLVESYVLMKKFNLATQLLDRNISTTEYPSIDHANCMYTKGWLLSEQGNRKEALHVLNDVLEEFHILKDRVYPLLFQENLTDKEFDFFYRALEEIKCGIADTVNLMEED